MGQLEGRKPKRKRRRNTLRVRANTTEAFVLVNESNGRRTVPIELPPGVRIKRNTDFQDFPENL